MALSSGSLPFALGDSPSPCPITYSYSDFPCPCPITFSASDSPITTEERDEVRARFPWATNVLRIDAALNSYTHQQFTFTPMPSQAQIRRRNIDAGLIATGCSDAQEIAAWMRRGPAKARLQLSNSVVLTTIAEMRKQRIAAYDAAQLLGNSNPTAPP